jgi:hypothetical protein
VASPSKLSEDGAENDLISLAEISATWQHYLPPNQGKGGKENRGLIVIVSQNADTAKAK